MSRPASMWASSASQMTTVVGARVVVQLLVPLLHHAALPSTAPKRVCVSTHAWPPYSWSNHWRDTRAPERADTPGQRRWGVPVRA